MRRKSAVVEDHEAEMGQYVREDILNGTRDFWSYVDSERLGGAWRAPDSEWTAIRNDGCLATRTDGDRCRRPLLVGMPFCDFHIGDAARAIRAYCDGELKRQLDDKRHLVLRNRAEIAIERGQTFDAEAVLREAHRSVYFFLVPGRAVKIGYSTWPKNRAASLRNKGGGALAPEGLDTSTGYLYAVIGGGRAVEKNLHFSLQNHRICGEWFRLTDAVLAAMEVAKAEQDETELQATA
jgi:hypothetical protein